MSNPLFMLLCVLLMIVALIIRIKIVQPIKNRPAIRRIRITMIIAILLVAVVQFIRVAFL